MEKMFQEMAKEMDKKFTRRRKKYGDSWKTEPIILLERGLHTEIQELSDARTFDEIQAELLDISIYCTFLHKRIEEMKCGRHCKHFVSGTTCNKNPNLVPERVKFCMECEAI